MEFLSRDYAGLSSAHIKRLLALLMFSVIVLYADFFPAMTMLFYSGDDFRYALGGFEKACSTDDGFYFMQALGRPLQAYLDCFSYKFAYTLERMSILRGISVLFISIALVLFADYLMTLGFSFFTAFVAAGTIILTHRLYIDSVITASIPLPLSIIFVLLAYMMLNKAYLSSQSKYWYAGSGILILCSLLTYPATGFFFGSLLLAKLLFSPVDHWNKTRLELLKESLLFVGVCFIYLCWAHYNMQFNALAPVPDQYRISHLNLNLKEMIVRILMLSNVFNRGWELFPGVDLVRQGWFVLSVLAVGLVTILIKSRAQDKIVVLQLIIGFFTLYGLSSAFSLVIPERDMASRLIFGFGSASTVILVWCVYSFVSFFPAIIRNIIFTGLIGCYFLLQAYYANLYISNYSLSAVNRLDYMKHVLLGYMKTVQPIKRIHFIVKQTDYPYDRFFQVNAVLAQLLGHNAYSIQWCSLPRGVIGAEKDHQQEMLTCLKSLPSDGIAVTYSYLKESYQITSNMVIIKNDNAKL